MKEKNFREIIFVWHWAWNDPDIKRYNRKSRLIQEQRRLLILSFTKKILLFNVKDFIFYKYICEIYILADIK